MLEVLLHHGELGGPLFIVGGGLFQLGHDGVDDVMLGWILLLAGVLSIVVGLVASRNAGRTKVVEERRERL